jgi:acyl carrier protein
MASESTVAIQIRAALAQHLKRDVSKVRREDRLREDLGLDSLAMIELLFKIEEHFDLEIPNEDLSRVTTVADVTAYVEEKLGTGARRPAASVKARPPAPAKATVSGTVRPADRAAAPRPEPVRAPAKVTPIKLAAKKKAAANTSAKAGDKRKGSRRA